MKLLSAAFFLLACALGAACASSSLHPLLGWKAFQQEAQLLERLISEHAGYRTKGYSYEHVRVELNKGWCELSFEAVRRKPGSKSVIANVIPLHALALDAEEGTHVRDLWLNPIEIKTTGNQGEIRNRQWFIDDGKRSCFTNGHTGEYLGCEFRWVNCSARIDFVSRAMADSTLHVLQRVARLCGAEARAKADPSCLGSRMEDRR